MFDSPFLQFDYGTGVYHITDGERTAAYDFNI